MPMEQELIQGLQENTQVIQRAKQDLSHLCHKKVCFFASMQSKMCCLVSYSAGLHQIDCNMLTMMTTSMSTHLKR